MKRLNSIVLALTIPISFSSFAFGGLYTGEVTPPPSYKPALSKAAKGMSSISAEGKSSVLVKDKVLLTKNKKQKHNKKKTMKKKKK